MNFASEDINKLHLSNYERLIDILRNYMKHFIPEYATTKSYQIRTHEIDIKGVLSLPGLVMLMQDASMESARFLKLSIWDERMKDLSWVLLRKEIKIYRLPEFDEQIEMVTYPAGFEKIFAYRDFKAFDQKGDLIASAASTWTLMNMKDRKIARIPSFASELDLPAFESQLPKPETRLRISDDFVDTYQYQVRLYDLDWNNHVNNIVLFRLMLQGVDIEFFKGATISDFIFHIKSECFMDEKLTVSSLQVDNTTYHHKITGSDDRLIASAKSFWYLN